MAVGAPFMGAVNDLIQTNPTHALEIAGEILAGTVTLGAISHKLGLWKGFNRTQKLEVECLDEAAATEFPEVWKYTVMNVGHSVERYGPWAKFRWKIGKFRSEYEKGTTGLHTPVLVEDSLVSDPATVARMLQVQSGQTPVL